MISIQGTNKARTRLYQMNINKHWNGIQPIFEVYGLLGDESWEPLKKGMNYQAFLGFKKY
jgi:hypothetical protein